MAKTVGGKEYNEEGLVKKTKRRMKELFYGDRTYLPGHKKPVYRKKAVLPEASAKINKMQYKLKEQMQPKTTRTKQVEGGLKQAGLDEKDIAKFRSKK